MAEIVKGDSRQYVRLHISVPLIPPSINHYVKHTRLGVHYVTKEAKAFKDAVVIFTRGRHVVANAFSVTIAVFLGNTHGGRKLKNGTRIEVPQKLDCDNAAKVVLDALETSRVFEAPKPKGKKLSDAAVSVLKVSRFHDPKNPRTEITIEALDD
jgi:Holliday junction resolvase RusA-like endonuclease